MNPEASNYPWSQGGLELLQKIQGIVEANGGRYHLARTIELEGKIMDSTPVGLDDQWYALRNRPMPTPEQDQYIVDTWLTVPIHKVAKHLGLSDRMVYRRGLKLGMGQKRMIQGVTTLSNVHKEKRVKVSATGHKTEYFKSVNQAASHLCVHPSTMAKAIQTGYRIHKKYLITIVYEQEKNNQACS